MVDESSIMDFDNRIQYLRRTDESNYSLLERIFSFDSQTGSQVIPQSLRSKVLNYFGRRDSSRNIIETPEEVVERIEKQKIVKINNIWTGESTLFNSLRSDRPGIRGSDVEKEKKYVHGLIEDSKNVCYFCHPEKYTPEDVFGRIQGKHSITAANLAKYDVWSSLVIFEDHNPLKFTLDEFDDYLKTSFQWFEAVNNNDPQFTYPFFIWNCLPRAGASQVHGHCQILMSKEPYAGVQTLIKAYQNYKKENSDDYFQDLYQAHRSLELSHKNGDTLFFANITPIKEKEIVIISRDPSTNYKSRETIFKILRCFIDVMGVFNFNLSISCPPINNQEKFPYITRIVDRGSLLKSTADMGGMELYGSSVVADDPYKIIKILKYAFKTE